jgi:hypothetical protein
MVAHRSAPHWLIKVGDKFDRLVVISEMELRKDRPYYKCRCKCGKSIEKIIYGYSLIKRLTRSCGCLRDEIAVAHFHRHGATKGGKKDRLYIIWKAFRSRCLNKNGDRYEDYGGRGITFAIEWRAYESFRDWALSNGYEDHLTLDRRDTNGNYEPGNCRWVPLPEQSQNQRKRKATGGGQPTSLYKGVFKNGKGWAVEIKGVSIFFSHVEVESAFAYDYAYVQLFPNQENPILNNVSDELTLLRKQEIEEVVSKLIPKPLAQQDFGTLTIQLPCVYFMKDETLCEIKIGCAEDLLRRLKQIRLLRPASDIKLLGIIPGSVKEEREQHLKFLQFKLKGEWFRDSLETELCADPLFIKIP